MSTTRSGGRRASAVPTRRRDGTWAPPTQPNPAYVAGLRYAADPIMSRVLAGYGLEPPTLPWECEESSSLLTVRRAHPTRPNVIVDAEGRGQARWRKEAGTSTTRNAGEHVSYDITPAERYVTLEGVALPDTVLAAMTGRILSEVVDLPGAEHLRITGAAVHATFAHETGDTRIEVEAVDD